MKFFVIGLGSIGIRHARNLLTLGHEVCGYDMLPEKFIQAQKELGIPLSSKADGADAYVVCTPPSEHLPDIAEGIRRNKHVFVEKPISIPEDIEALSGALLKVAKEKNLVVMVGNMLRFHPNVILAKQHIKHPISATFRVKQKNTRYTEDVILNWGAHEIDLALYLFGPGKCKNAGGQKDQAYVNIWHDSGVRSTIYMDYLTEPEVRSFTVNTLDNYEHNVELTRHDWNAIYMAEIGEFIEHITWAHLGSADPNKYLGATGEDGLATLKIINDAQRMAGI